MQMTTEGAARIPALGLGTWQVQGRTCADRVADALAVGYRHVDTAQAYDNEEDVGRGLRRGAVGRDEVFLTTKLWRENLTRDAVLRTSEESLSRLGTDYVDLLLIHWPSDQVPVEETLDAMREIQERGRARHLGVSNFPPSWLERAAAHTTLVCDQVEYHPLLSQDHLLGPLRERGMALVAYSPLAHGEIPKCETLAEIGRAHGKSASQVALRWLVQQEGVRAIPKAASREHLEENFRVFDFDLDPAEMERIHALATRNGERTVDPEFAPSWERGA